MKNAIFIAFDDNYFKYARICMNSLRRNYPDHPTVKAAYIGEDPAILSFLESMPRVELFDGRIDMSNLSHYNLGVIGSPMIYVRFILWSDQFKDFDNIVYLDCDTVILKPFPELFEHQDFFVMSDNSDEPIFYPDKRDDPELTSLLQADGVSSSVLEDAMVNSGVFMIPKKYRSKANFETMLALQERYNSFIVHSDQSIISIWCRMNHIPLSRDFRYNFQTQYVFGPAILEVGLEAIKIMHYSYYKPDKNFTHLTAAANYVLKAADLFAEYSTP